ncbi:fluoride export protein 1-like [Bidens hawaiensis]|uniref:fluoride export protein 1-like n=1 Tax=Bidens hawaiensis TaxID=980011 RepID=UPI0040497017
MFAIGESGKMNESEQIISGSFNRLGSSAHEIDDDSVSEAGDIGDRALHSRNGTEEDMVLPILKQHSFKETLLEKDHNEARDELPWFLAYISSRIHLAVLGILGVLTRYLPEKLFGPQVVGATSDHSYMYIDLPPNMVGSFLMGWFGVVFKGDTSNFSPELAVGLTTGYLGSLTTFSGWNQKMLELSVDGYWVFSVLGLVLGLFLVAYSFIFGVETAKGLKWAFNRTNLSSKCQVKYSTTSQTILIVVMVTMLGWLWGVSVTLLMKDFNTDSSTAHLWLGCIVGPLGVWIRFYLAQLNGQGVGRTQMMKWMPFGTLIANVTAACIMAAFATMKKYVKDEHFDIVATGIQFGFCGCLSTVSTFISEFEAMKESMHPWRAYVYTLTTMIVSFTLGTLIYSVPVWTEGWSYFGLQLICP